VVTVLIAGGGTGGHVFPMLAVGEAIERSEAGARVVYVGTERGMEARLVPDSGKELELLDVLPLRGGGLRGFISGAARALAVLPAARRLIDRIRPDVVLSVGGYAAGPVSLAARTKGVPVALLEPNSYLGLSNRLLAPLVSRAYTAFPEVERQLRPSAVCRAGVPLRRAFSPIEYAPSDGPLRILVLGGSLGAAKLNEIVPRAVSVAIAAGTRVTVVHQTGRAREDDARRAYAAEGIGSDIAEVTPFIADVASALASADVVIQRAGASSLAELCAVGRPAILVPFPYAADQHQLQNARSLERAGAAVTLPEPEATPERLARDLQALASDPARRTAMALAARNLGRPEAAREVARDLLELAARRRREP
jgi:UDP-N-acetylglucosamine--N-acetylmuramyl-(pentapeptide) pyrophosphoryl-undecaprenol N-acetylglucosamine transferase